jgi:ubiquinol-cytochrome c reductase cytochrome b subunit/menaquinol-cytochrome c reductase cytochrome b/c subunit
MACVTLAVIITMSIVFGAELGPKADPTTTTYTPRPEWYFFFLFELLRVIKPPKLVILAMIGIPTILLLALALLPFYDRNPERRPERRPIAMSFGVATIALMAYLTYLGAHAGAPDQIDLKVPASAQAGQQVANQSGCGACHKFGDNGNNGPGPELTEIGAKLPAEGIKRTLINPSGVMPVFAPCGAPGASETSCLPPEKFNNLIAFLGSLR